MAVLIIVSGRPCTGKTELSRRVATACGLPWFTRDGLKESLFDSLGWNDRAWSKRLGGASWELLYYVLERMLEAQQSCLIESNFVVDFDRSRLQTLVERFGYRTLEVYCHTDAEVLVERFRARAVSGARHPGHVDHLNLEEFEPVLRRAGYDLLALGGPHVVVDTTDFAAVDYPGVIAAVRTVLLSGSGDDQASAGPETLQPTC